MYDSEKNNSDKKQAQVLVIVLIVLVVLAVIIVSMSNTIIKDTQQSENNVAYEKLYSKSETYALLFAQELDSENDQPIENQVDSIIQNSGFDLVLDGCQTKIEPTTKTSVCKMIDESAGIHSDLRLVASPHLVDVEVKNNHNIVYFLSETDYAKNFKLVIKDWEGNPITSENLHVKITLDFEYTDLSTQRKEFSSISGLYSFGLTQSQNQEQNMFFDLDFSQGIISFDIIQALEAIRTSHIQNFADISRDIKPLGIRIKPILTNTQTPNDGSFLIYLEGDLPTQNIVQTRSIEITSYQINKQNQIYGPQVILHTSIPTYKPPSILDYVYRTEDAIE